MQRMVWLREKRPKMLSMHDLAQNEKHSEAENWE